MHDRNLPAAWVYPTVVVALTTVLAVFWWWSRHQTWATQQPGLFHSPPIYGIFDPTWSRYGALALFVVAIAAASTRVLLSPGVRAWVFLPVAVALGTLLSFLVNTVRGQPRIMLHALCEQRGCRSSYGRDAASLRRVGTRNFVSGFPHTYRSVVQSVENRTHPPGALVLWNWIVETFGHGYRAAWFMAGVTMLTVVSAWIMGRVIDGERTGRLAALLVVVAPAALLYGFTSMDGVFAALLSMAGALFLVAAYRRLWWLAGIAGVLVGLTTFVTYAAVFIAAAGAVTTVVVTRNVRVSLSLLGSAFAGGVVALIGLRVVFGFDLFASNATVTRIAYQPHPMRYWVLGTPAAFLISAGVVTAAFGVVGMVTRRPPMTIVLVAGMLVFADLPRTITGLYPGEIERTWLFVLPFFCTAAGLALADWERVSTTARRHGAVAVVALGGAFAVLVQAMYDTLR